MSSDAMPAPEYTPDDLRYIEAEYATLGQLCAGRSETADAVRRLVDDGRLPKPAYTLPDGTEMYPPDYFELVDSAGGVDNLRDHFDERHRVVTTMLGLPDVDPSEDWKGYLSGDYGVCLRELTPEAMVEKTTLVSEIESLVALPAPGDEKWLTRLRSAVDELAELARPFTDYDRQRWGGTSRDAHITAVRARFLH